MRYSQTTQTAVGRKAANCMKKHVQTDAFAKFAKLVRAAAETVARMARKGAA
jgi:hypothetical protein